MNANAGLSTVYFWHRARMLSSFVGSYCGSIGLIFRQLIPPFVLIQSTYAWIALPVSSLLKFDPNANADCTAPRFGIGMTTLMVDAVTPWSAAPAGLRHPAGPCVPVLLLVPPGP